MPTRFTSLGVAGTATIATLIATAVTLTTVTITTANVTTINATTANVQTGSASTLRVGVKLLNSGSLVVEGNSTFQSPVLSTVVAKATVSGTSLRLNQPGAGLEVDPLCVKTDGSIGYLPRSSTGSIGFVCT